MKRATMICLIVAAALIVLGGLVSVWAMSQNDWEFAFSSKLETREVVVSEAFQDILIRTDTEKIAFRPSDDGKCRVIFTEREKERHTAVVRDRTLRIGVEDTRKWYDHFSLFSSGISEITVCLPQAEYAALKIDEKTGDISLPEDFSFESIHITVSTGDVSCAASAKGDLKIGASTGDIHVKGVTAADLELSVSTGRVELSEAVSTGAVVVTVSTGKAKLSDVQCVNLYSDGSTGDLKLENVVASGVITVQRSTGDVSFEQCDAAELAIKTDTGDVKGSLRSSKVFIVSSDTGRIDVPESVTGGKCKITTDTGDIRITTP